MSNGFPIEVCDSSLTFKYTERKRLKYLYNHYRDDCCEDIGEPWHKYARFGIDYHINGPIYYYSMEGEYVSGSDADMIHEDGHYVISWDRR